MKHETSCKRKSFQQFMQTKNESRPAKSKRKTFTVHMETEEKSVIEELRFLYKRMGPFEKGVQVSVLHAPLKFEKQRRTIR